MLNISRRAMKDGRVPITFYPRVIFGPDFYLAANVRDFLQSRDNLPYPWYKRARSPVSQAFVILNNVGLEILEDDDDELSGAMCVRLHDTTAEMVAIWPNNSSGPSLTLRNFKEVQEKDGLTVDDWVSRVYLKYLIGHDVPIIIDVEKNSFSPPTRGKKKTSRIWNIFDQQPLPNPAT